MGGEGSGSFLGELYLKPESSWHFHKPLPSNKGEGSAIACLARRGVKGPFIFSEFSYQSEHPIDFTFISVSWIGCTPLGTRREFSR